MRDLHSLDKYRDRNFERQYYGTNGDAGNGVFRVPVGEGEELCKLNPPSI